MQTIQRLAIVLSLVLGPVELARGQSYTFTTIDVPAATGTGATGINNSGQIIGGFLSGGTFNGFVDVGGVFTTLNKPGATSTLLFANNASGMIVGGYPVGAGPDNPFETANGFLYSGGVFTTLNYPGASITTPFSINAGATVVGLHRGADGIGHGFVYTGAFSPFDVPGAFATQAHGINDAGHIVGFYRAFGGGPHHGFLYDGTSFTTVDCSGATETQPQKINNLGDIVGIYSTGGAPIGFLRKAGICSVIAVPGALVTVPLGINDQDAIVGIYTSDGVTLHGFLATPSVLTVSIMIKPRAAPPVPINPGAEGKIPVAILSTASFNAVTQVNTTSLTFGHTGNENSLAFCAPGGEDVNADGSLDLVCLFNTPTTGFVAGDTVATLKGATVSGQKIQGSEAMVIVPR